MQNRKNDNLVKAAQLLAGVILVTLVYSCANIARPGGGPKDVDPPVFVKSLPTPGQLNVKRNKIELDFDEIVLIEKPSEKIIVSPYQREMPTVRSNGKKIQIILNDSLQPNTTYTIDFADAIVDNNEKNALNDFSFAFSTGNVIDSLQVSGILLNAENLEPITGMMVGLQPDLSDSAFQTKPLQRLALTDAFGRFTIRNVAGGKYKIYALKDINRDFIFDNPTEDIAFSEQIIDPYAELKIHPDTFWIDSVTVDTIEMVKLAHYYPNDLVLRSFNENFKSQYLEKNDRTDRRKFSLYFSAPADTLPMLRPLNFEEKDWAVIEKSQHNDTISYWIKDSMIYRRDTLQFVASYLRTDSLRKLAPYTDTLRMIYRAPRRVNTDARRKKEEKPVMEFLNIDSRIGSPHHIYNRLEFVASQPILRMDTAGIILEQKVDTLWNKIKYKYAPDSVNIRGFQVFTKWKPGAEYRLTIDSAAIEGLYGIHNNKMEKTFKVKTLEEYSNLYFGLSELPDSAFVELLNTSDAPVRRVPVKKGGAEFLFLDPGTYYARIIIDRNHNGKYDTGNYDLKLQPEEVFYYPGKLDLKANWDVEQDWDIKAVPLMKQKPREIVKNKPKDQIKTGTDSYDSNG